MCLCVRMSLLDAAVNSSAAQQNILTPPLKAFPSQGSGTQEMCGELALFSPVVGRQGQQGLLCWAKHTKVKCIFFRKYF